MGMAVVPMVGPAIGGFLEHSFGWRANFWLLFGAGVAITALVWADLGETAPKSQNSLAGQFREYPELLRSPRFWGYCLSAAFSSGAFFSFLGGAPFVGAQVFDLAPHELGLYFAAPSVGYFFGNYVSGTYSARIGMNRMVLFGLLISVAATGTSLVMTGLGMQSLNSFFALMIPVGLGNGMSIPNGMAGMLSVRPRLAGTASGLGGAIMLAGGAGLSALAGMSLQGGHSAAPLLVIMTTSGLCGVAVILAVMRRAARLGSNG
jgi:DHA1 family bicyclomycin/chloramphenicol resistance-like MFS transporter